MTAPAAPGPLVDAASALPGELIDATERRRAVEELSTSFVVEAGAGTGKTTLMVNRILQIIRSGAAAVDEIVAITFTEKAAGELRTRLRAQLDAQSRIAGGEERVRLRQALERFDQAYISTIHAFAGSLLREQPVEARLDPAFTVLDELAEAQSFDAAFDAWLDEQLAGEASAARDALNLGLDLTRFREAAAFLHRERDLLPERWPAPEPFARAELLAWLQEQASVLLRLSGSCGDEADRGYKAIQEITRWTEMVSRASPEAFDRLVAQRAKFDVGGNQANWKGNKQHCVDQKELCTAINDRLQLARETLGQQAAVELAEWLGSFVREFAAERRLSGVAEFQDLLIWARDLLRDSPTARAYYQRRFAFILVDEFQDTDPLQVEIVFFLAEQGIVASRWEDVRLTPGKLFIVGDPKQAIYRFRRADITTYQRAQDVVVANGGEVLGISQNFRSVAPLISWVNSVFERVMGAGVPPYQCAYHPLHASKPAHPGREQPPVVVLLPTPQSQTTTAAAVRRSEGQVLARLVRQIVDGPWPLLTRGEGGEWTTRPARYRDVTLLFATTTDIELFEEALRIERVPYRVEGGKLFYNRQEVGSSIALQRLTTRPTKSRWWRRSSPARSRSRMRSFSPFLMAAIGSTTWSTRARAGRDSGRRSRCSGVFTRCGWTRRRPRWLRDCSRRRGWLS